MIIILTKKCVIENNSFVGYSNSSTFTNNKAVASVVDTGWSAGGFTGAMIGLYATSVGY